MIRGVARVAMAGMMGGGCGIAAGQPCMEWGREFAGADLTGGSALCSARFDDGSGESLFVGGTFRTAGGIATVHVARWDGASWHGLGGGVGSPGSFTRVSAMVGFDADQDGPSPARLYAGGSFLTIGGVASRSIARWDGSGWEAMGTGVAGNVRALAVFDEDGAGPGAACLFVAGNFRSVSGVPAESIARWDGVSWTAVGEGIPGGTSDGHIRTMVVHDDGSGPALYVGGAFDQEIGGTRIRKLARWDGKSWSAVGGSLDASGGLSINSLASFDGLGGPLLVSAGRFSSIGGVAVDNLAAWDGKEWRNLGASLGPAEEMSVAASFTRNGETKLYVSGAMRDAAGDSFSVAGWDGAAWFELGEGTSNSPAAFGAFDRGEGEELVVLGGFSLAGGFPAGRFALWDGSAWIRRTNAINGVVSALSVFDDGSGPLLYAGGEFNFAGSRRATDIARWDGVAWAPLGPDGSGISSESVTEMFATDHPAVRGLYVSGFARIIGDPRAFNGVGRWDGSAWHTMGTGFGNNGRRGTTNAGAFEVFDDGTGAALYAVGGFRSTGGIVSRGVGVHGPGGMTGFGAGLDGRVHCGVQFDDGSGSAYYVGGEFTTSNGAPAARIAKWTGSAWATVGGGATGGLDLIRSMAVFDEDGDGPQPARLFVGGRFTRIGGVTISGVARWDGAAWSALGSGISEGSSVQVVRVLDDGTGAALYVSGGFDSAGGVADTKCVARWTGSAWESVAAAPKECVGGAGLAMYDSGQGMQLYAGTSTLYRVSNGAWEAVKTFNNSITDLAVFDDGKGAALYIGGQFVSDNTFTESYRRLAKWDGTAFTEVGGGVHEGANSDASTRVRSLEVFDDGTGPALHVGGDFTRAGDVATPNFAKWDGSAWRRLDGVMPADTEGVYDLAAVETADGPRLLVTGAFGAVDLKKLDGFAKWDGTEWRSVGPPLGAGGASSMCVFDDGTGPALYLGGRFTTAGDVTVNHIAKWDGTTLTPLGSGLVGDPESSLTRVYSLVVFDDGSGPALYAGGDFGSAGGVASPSVARWDGAAWSAVGAGLSTTGGGTSAVTELLVFDDGAGARLYAAGAFNRSGATPLAFLARWNGVAWEDVGGGLSAVSHCLSVWGPKGEPASLFIGGAFTLSGSTLAEHVARWGPCEEEPGCPADWDGSGAVNSQDFFSFLTSFFGESADFNGDGVTDSRDFFDFLVAFFEAC